MTYSYLSYALTVYEAPFKLITSYLTNSKQYTYIKDGEAYIISTQVVPQGSVLGLMLFLIYINDLNKVIQHSVIHPFVNEINLLYSSNSLKQINRHVNHDLKLIVHWL